MTTDQKIETAVTFIVGLFLFVLGITRVGGGYVLYSNIPTAGNFLWVQFTALLVAFGATGIIVAVIRPLAFARKQDNSNSHH